MPLLGVCILSVQIGKSHHDIATVEIFEMQEFDDVTLLEFHRSGTFRFSAIYVVVLPAISSRENLKLSRHPSISRRC
jgi:hypothetical protein